MWVGIYFSLILLECIAEIASSLFFHSKAWGELRFLNSFLHALSWIADILSLKTIETKHTNLTVTS